MTLVPSFSDRLRCMVGARLNPINDNGRRGIWRLETQTSECMGRVLGTLHDISGPMQLQAAKAILAMAKSDSGEFVDVGDADPWSLRELTYGLVVLEEGRSRNPTFRIPHPGLREELRKVNADMLVALAQSRRW